MFLILNSKWICNVEKCGKPCSTECEPIIYTWSYINVMEYTFLYVNTATETSELHFMTSCNREKLITLYKEHT